MSRPKFVQSTYSVSQWKKCHVRNYFYWNPTSTLLASKLTFTYTFAPNFLPLSFLSLSFDSRFIQQFLSHSHQDLLGSRFCTLYRADCFIRPWKKVGIYSLFIRSHNLVIYEDILFCPETFFRIVQILLWDLHLLQPLSLWWIVLFPFKSSYKSLAFPSLVRRVHVEESVLWGANYFLRGKGPFGMSESFTK